MEQILKFEMGGDCIVDVEDQPKTISGVASALQECLVRVSGDRRHRDRTFGRHGCLFDCDDFLPTILLRKAKGLSECPDPWRQSNWRPGGGPREASVFVALDG